MPIMMTMCAGSVVWAEIEEGEEDQWFN